MQLFIQSEAKDCFQFCMNKFELNKSGHTGTLGLCYKSKFMCKMHVVCDCVPCQTNEMTE